MDFLKVVEGVSGSESSYQIVYDLAKFVLASKNLHTKDFLTDLGLMNQLCDHKV
jgi:hypothetical protein